MLCLRLWYCHVGGLGKPNNDGQRPLLELIGEAFRIVLCMQEEADERAKIAEEAAAAAEDASEEEGEEADSDGDPDDEGSGEFFLTRLSSFVK